MPGRRVFLSSQARELRRAAAEKVDLIVMGVYSGRPFNDMFFGSATHHVVRGADCPVLIVRPRGAGV